MRTAKELLTQILGAVTESIDAPWDVIAKRIGPNLEKELTNAGELSVEYSALCQRDSTDAKFSEELKYGNQVKLLVSRPQSVYPDLAHLVLDSRGNWKLRSFLFQCPACFGNGMVVDMELCGSCGAKGWGTINF